MVGLARTTLGLGASRPATSTLGGSRGAGLGDTAATAGSELGRTARQSLLPPDAEPLRATFGVRSASGGKTAGAVRGARLAKMNALQVRQEVERENPALARSATLRQNSGRYSRDASVSTIDAPMARLQTLVAGEVESFARAAPRDQVVVVACLRSDSRECERARQVLESLHALQLRGELPCHARGQSFPGGGGSSGASGPGTAGGDRAEAGDSRGGPFSLVTVDMAVSGGAPAKGRGTAPKSLTAAIASSPLPCAQESRAMVERYGVHTVPFFLMFVGGELVRGTTLGGRARLVASGQALPRVLLVEPSFKDQLRQEKVLRRAGYVADLAVSDKEAMQRDRVTKVRCSAQRGAGAWSRCDPARAASRLWGPGQRTGRARDATSPGVIPSQNDEGPLGSRGYGIVLLSGELDAAERRDAAASFLSRGGARGISPAPLLATLHPYGTFRTAARMCPLCEELCGRKVRLHSAVPVGDADPSWPHTPLSSPVHWLRQANVEGWAESGDTPVACPHCSIVEVRGRAGQRGRGESEKPSRLLGRHPLARMTAACHSPRPLRYRRRATWAA